jgi:hypothetical protein
MSKIITKQVGLAFTKSNQKMIWITAKFLLHWLILNDEIIRKKKNIMLEFGSPNKWTRRARWELDLWKFKYIGKTNSWIPPCSYQYWFDLQSTVADRDLFYTPRPQNRILAYTILSNDTCEVSMVAALWVIIWLKHRSIENVRSVETRWWK